MANQIRITPDQMRDRAQEYRVQAEKVQEVINKMDDLLEKLKTEWEGAASEAYATRYGELRPGFVSAMELINSIVTALNSTANIIEETDQSIASQFKG